jgi:hypothetical protein
LNVTELFIALAAQNLAKESHVVVVPLIRLDPIDDRSSPLDYQVL